MLGTLWRTIESYGIDPATLISEQLFRPGQVTPGRERIRFEVYDAIQRKVIDHVGDPAFGLRSAQFLHPSHLGALGHAWLNSLTLYRAIERASRYVRMCNEELVIRLEESADEVIATYHMHRQPSRCEVVSDAQLACLYALCRMNAGEDLVPSRVEVRRERPGDAEPWNAYFRVPVRFGAGANRFGLRSADAHRTLTGANVELRNMHEEVLRRKLMQLDRESIISRLRLDIIHELPSGGVNEEAMASRLNMSKRTLHRKLKNSETSFRELLSDIRMQLAERYISDPTFSVTEIAFMLGYADSSAFSRAFRRWYDRSPSEFREQRIGLD